MSLQLFGVLALKNVDFIDLMAQRIGFFLGELSNLGSSATDYHCAGGVGVWKVSDDFCNWIT